MQCRMDKRVIELLNQQGVAITWDQFRTAYDARRKERSTPKSDTVDQRPAEQLPCTS